MSPVYTEGWLAPAATGVRMRLSSHTVSIAPGSVFVYPRLGTLTRSNVALSIGAIDRRFQFTKHQRQIFCLIVCV